MTQGGYEGAEPEVSLTAFVLIALQEARQICKDHVKVSSPVWGEGRQQAPVTQKGSASRRGAQSL